MAHPIDSEEVREEVKRKAALLGTGAGKIVVEFDHTQGKAKSYRVRVEFARRDVA